MVKFIYLYIYRFLISLYILNYLSNLASKVEYSNLITRTFRVSILKDMIYEFFFLECTSRELNLYRIQ